MTQLGKYFPYMDDTVLFFRSWNTLFNTWKVGSRSATERWMKSYEFAKESWQMPGYDIGQKHTAIQRMLMSSFFSAVFSQVWTILNPQKVWDFSNLSLKIPKSGSDELGTCPCAGERWRSVCNERGRASLLDLKRPRSRERDGSIRWCPVRLLV